MRKLTGSMEVIADRLGIFVMFRWSYCILIKIVYQWDLRLRAPDVDLMKKDVHRNEDEYADDIIRTGT